MTDQSTVATEDLRLVLDALHSSLDWGSEFLDQETIDAANRLMKQLGFRCFEQYRTGETRLVHSSFYGSREYPVLDRCPRLLGHDGDHGPADG